MKKALLVSAILSLTLGLWAEEGTMMKADKSSDGSMMKSGTMQSDGNAMKAMDKSAYDLSGLGWQVVAFTTEAAAQALAQKGTAVYFFAATWCPDCQATYQDLKKNFARLPANLTLIFVNYDKSADLKKKYGVTVQHTYVVVGPSGEKKKVWSGAATTADIVKNATSM